LHQAAGVAAKVIHVPGVQRDVVPDVLGALGRDAFVDQERARDQGAFDLKPVRAGRMVGEPQVVQHGRQEHQLPLRQCCAKNDSGERQPFRHWCLTLPKCSSTSLSETGFEEEIKRLSEEANELNGHQEKLRTKYVRESETVASINHQIQTAYASLREYAGDRKFLANVKNSQELICPTCGAEHEQSFLHYLGYAEDARILEELTRTLQGDLITAKREMDATNSEMGKLRGNYSRINSILEKRRGEVKFREVVESQGAQAAHRAFDVEREQISSELAHWNAKLSEISIRLAELTDKKRAQRIVREFRTAYALARKALNVPDPSGNPNLTSRPNRSGSGGPRLLLAYYAALWKICHGEQLNVSLPVVIDSPNQQDQDDLNLHVVLGFIAESLPASMQLIVCVTKHSEAQLDRTVVFDKKYNLLQPESYDEVESDIGPLYRKMNAALLSTPITGHEDNAPDPETDS
jgi:uncharacterized Zn finger protein (UPF0148 family)